MNIFYVNRDPQKAATELVDKHVVKMPLETAQLLCSVFEQGVAPYRRTHYNHPSAIWTRKSKANYEWLINHGLALCEEYTHRYKKNHKSEAVIRWCKERINDISWLDTSFSDPPACMPEDCKLNDVVLSYQEYYRKHKSYIYSWTNRQKPDWA
ncbi:hypothetical protein EBZ38_07640 [bacterium]|nr:hypothetical protein [bacterium]